MAGFEGNILMSFEPVSDNARMCGYENGPGPDGFRPGKKRAQTYCHSCGASHFTALKQHMQFLFLH